MPTNTAKNQTCPRCEKRFEEIDRALSILIRAVLAFGTLQGRPSTQDIVDRELVSALVTQLERR